MLDKFVNFACCAVLAAALVGCSQSLGGFRAGGEGSALTPNDTIVEQKNNTDECFVDCCCSFVAHGFDEMKTEYTYTRADVLESAYFKFDSAKLSASERAKVADIAKIFTKNKTLHVLLVGNCDKFGKEQYNYSLGQLRAEAVRDIFLGAGISADRITIASLGSCNAREDVEIKEEGAIDRRCDIVIHKM